MVIFKRVAGLVDEYFIYDGELSTDTKFVEDLGADSLDIVEFMLRIEEEFGVEISEEEMATIVTLGDAVNYIKNRAKIV